MSTFATMRFYLVAPLVVLVTIYYTVVSSVAMLFDRSGRRYLELQRGWSRSLLRLFGISLAVTGADRIDPAASYVYLANHASYLDIIALGAGLPQGVRFIFKQELARIPIFGWGLALGANILIDRADPRDALASIERAAAKIRAGASVVIFPEGTRTHDGKLGPFKRGGLMLALKSGVPMVPVAVRGTYDLMSRNDRRVRSGRVEIVIGETVPSPVGLNRAEEKELVARIHAELERLLHVGTSSPLR